MLHSKASQMWRPARTAQQCCCLDQKQTHQVPTCHTFAAEPAAGLALGHAARVDGQQPTPRSRFCHTFLAGPGIGCVYGCWLVVSCTASAAHHKVLLQSKHSQAHSSISIWCAFKAQVQVKLIVLMGHS